MKINKGFFFSFVAPFMISISAIGLLLKDNAKIKIVNNNPSKRPIVVHADHIEAKDVISVEIEMSEGIEIPLLF